jgi:hypothetical protein
VAKFKMPRTLFMRFKPATRIPVGGRLTLHDARGVVTTILQMPSKLDRRAVGKLPTIENIPLLFVVVLPMTLLPHLSCTVASAKGR